MGRFFFQIITKYHMEEGGWLAKMLLENCIFLALPSSAVLKSARAGLVIGNFTSKGE
jgi:hypothetical protein